LDHDVTLGHIFQLSCVRQACQGGLHGGRLDALLIDLPLQPAADGADAHLRVVAREEQVVCYRLETRRRAHLRDAAAHGAAADDSNLTNVQRTTSRGESCAAGSHSAGDGASRWAHHFPRLHGARAVPPAARLLLVAWPANRQAWRLS